MQDFEEYIRQGEPAQREKASTWQTAIGLQDVDGLKPSAYLLDTARRHVEGDITIDEVQHSSRHTIKARLTILAMRMIRKRPTAPLLISLAS